MEWRLRRLTELGFQIGLWNWPDHDLAMLEKSGATFSIRPGDVLLAQDNTGTGHKWRLIGDEPWRRAYVVFEEGADLRFMAAPSRETPHGSG